MYVYNIYIYMYICTYTHVSVYIYIYHTYTDTHIYIYIYLVGGFNTSEKYEFVNWNDDIPNWMEKSSSHVPVTTNQICSPLQRQENSALFRQGSPMLLECLRLPPSEPVMNQGKVVPEQLVFSHHSESGQEGHSRWRIYPLVIGCIAIESGHL